MKFFWKKSMVPMALAFTMMLGTVASAATYKDVPNGHWARNAIDKVSDQGYLVGDLSGNFKPNEAIDKFETAKILAKMTGYKYANATADEKAYYDRCYESNKAVINQYANKFTKWNATVNKEIAFLMEKDVLTQTDLSEFVVFHEGKERLRALSREEATAYFVRLMGKKNDALSTPVGTPFRDDTSIAGQNRNYVYYLRSLGIINGDGNNNFNPKNAVTRAAMAVMVEKVDAIMAKPSASQTTAIGTIGKLYSSFNAIEVVSTDIAFNGKIYTINPDAKITVNGATKTYADLQEGMSFTAAVAGDKITTISAVGGNTAVIPNLPADTTTIEGIITNLRFDSTGNYFSVEVKMVGMSGDIYTEVRTYSIPSNCVITRGGKTTNHLVMSKDDIVKVKANGNIALNIELQEKNMKFSGRIVEKKIIAATQTPVIVCKDSNDKLYELKVASDSKITRKGIGTTSWINLRVGDDIDITSEYGKILTLDAFGSYSSVDAWVREIHIKNDGSYIIGANADGVETKYPIISGKVDPYTLRIGSKLRLRLDSSEIDSITILQDAVNTYNMTGQITYISRTLISVKDTNLGGTTRDFKVDSATIITDAATGKAVSMSYLENGMRVYVVTNTAASDVAKTITILSN